MRKKPTRKRPYFMMESAMTAILRDASGNMHNDTIRSSSGLHLRSKNVTREM